MIEAVFLGMMIPLAFLILILKGDSKVMMAFFAWGQVAFMISLSVNIGLAELFGITAGNLSVTWAPVVEEFFKALPLIYFLINKKNYDYPIIYFAMAAGIGFSIIENYMYLTGQSGLSSSPVLYIIIRGFTTSLMHGISTAIIGFGLQLIRKYGIMINPIFFGLFTLSVTLHALFNLYINSKVQLIAIILPILLYLIGVVLLTSDQSKEVK